MMKNMSPQDAYRIGYVFCTLRPSRRYVPHRVSPKRVSYRTCDVRALPNLWIWQCCTWKNNRYDEIFTMYQYFSTSFFWLFLHLFLSPPTPLLDWDMGTVVLYRIGYYAYRCKLEKLWCIEHYCRILVTDVAYLGIKVPNCATMMYNNEAYVHELYDTPTRGHCEAFLHIVSVSL